MALSIVFFFLMIVAFWFLVLKPARAKQAAAAKMVSALQVGQRVMTTAGMFGYIREISDDEVALEIADGVTVWMLKPAIAKIAEVAELQGTAEQTRPSDLPPDPTAAAVPPTTHN